MKKCTDEKDNNRCDVSAVSHFNDWDVQMSNAPPMFYEMILKFFGVQTVQSKYSRVESPNSNCQDFFLVKLYILAFRQTSAIFLG